MPMALPLLSVTLGESSVEPVLGSRLHPESSLTRECFERGQVMICEDTEEDSRVRLAAKSLRLRSAVVVPVQAQGSVLGVVEVLSAARLPNRENLPSRDDSRCSRA